MDTKDGTIWMIEHHRREEFGHTWRLDQPYHIYKRLSVGLEAVRAMNERARRVAYRLVEYRRVGD